MKAALACCVVLAAALCAVVRSQAEFEYLFTDKNCTSEANYTLAEGCTVVPVGFKGEEFNSVTLNVLASSLCDMWFGDFCREGNSVYQHDKTCSQFEDPITVDGVEYFSGYCIV